jgi:hypothetical protein
MKSFSQFITERTKSLPKKLEEGWLLPSFKFLPAFNGAHESVITDYVYGKKQDKFTKAVQKHDEELKEGIYEAAFKAGAIRVVHDSFQNQWAVEGRGPLNRKMRAKIELMAIEGEQSVLYDSGPEGDYRIIYEPRSE